MDDPVDRAFEILNRSLEKCKLASKQYWSDEEIFRLTGSEVTDEVLADYDRNIVLELAQFELDTDVVELGEILNTVEVQRLFVGRWHILGMIRSIMDGLSVEPDQTTRDFESFYYAIKIAPVEFCVSNFEAAMQNKTPPLGPRETRIIELLTDGILRTANEIAAQIDCDRKTVAPNLRNLKELGLIWQPHGPRKGWTKKK